jgi:hypothetical protein
MKKQFEGTDIYKIGKDPLDVIIQPANDQSSKYMFHAGKSGTIPMHWRNSSFLSGGSATSVFGLNPKKVKRKNVLSYEEFIEVSKKNSK